jgi:surfactin synthase thioesterase subunit
MTTSTIDSDAWIRRFQPAPAARVRLVCFPHAGGSASFYFPVARALAPGVEVLAVQYPGRQDRRADPNVGDIHELADLVTEAVRGWADRPLAFFGHSLGAVLAYEVGLRLEATGGELVRLFASGRRAPSRYRDENVHRRPDAGLIAELQALSGTDAAVLGDPEILRMIMPAIRSDYRAIETYRHDPARRLSAPITALTGDDDAKTTLDEAQAWSAHTTGGFDLRVFTGGHFFVSSQAPQVLAAITEQIG